MFRLLSLLLLLAASCHATLLLQSINCNGAAQSVQTSLSGNLIGNLRCDQNGVTAIASSALPVILDVVADTKGTTGYAEATERLVGSISITFSSADGSLPAYWAQCMNSVVSAFGPQSGGSVTGYVGTATPNSPCDFAHALPVSASGAITYSMDVTLNAVAQTQVTVQANQNLFNADGSVWAPVGGGGHISYLPDVNPLPIPEPSTTALVGLLLVAAGLFRFQPARY